MNGMHSVAAATYVRIIEAAYERAYNPGSYERSNRKLKVDYLMPRVPGTAAGGVTFVVVTGTIYAARL